MWATSSNNFLKFCNLSRIQTYKSVSELEGNLEYAKFKTSFYSWRKRTPKWTNDFPRGKQLIQQQSQIQKEHLLSVSCITFPSMNEKKVNGFQPSLQSQRTQVWLTEHPEHHQFTILLFYSLWLLDSIQEALCYYMRQRTEHFCPQLIFPSPGACHCCTALLHERRDQCGLLGKGIGTTVNHPRQARLTRQKMKYKTYIRRTLPLTSVGAVLTGTAGSAVEQRLE